MIQVNCAISFNNIFIRNEMEPHIHIIGKLVLFFVAIVLFYFVLFSHRRPDLGHL